MTLTFDHIVALSVSFAGLIGATIGLWMMLVIAFSF
jgi:hypothetical protein